MRLQQMCFKVFLTLAVGGAVGSWGNLWASDDTPTSGAVKSASASESAEQRAATAIQIGKERNTEQVDLLKQWLSDEKTLVRQSAAWALTQLGDAAEAALPQLKQALADRDARVRWAAATTLGQLGPKAQSVQETLLQATRDRDADVQCAALIALRTVGVSDIEPALTTIADSVSADIAEVQFEAVGTLTELASRAGDEARRQLAQSVIPALKAPNDDVRLATCVLLGNLRLSAAPAVPALVRMASDADEHVRAASGRALSRFADEVDEQWASLDAEQQELLRRPCESAAQALASDSRSDAATAELSRRFARLVDGIRLAAVADETSNMTPPDDVAHVTHDTPSEPLPVPVDVEATAASLATTSADRQSAVLWGVGLVMVAVGLLMLLRGGAKADKAESGASRAQTQSQGEAAPRVEPVAAVSADTLLAVQAADLDLIEAHVVPAVVASLPTAEGVDETARTATAAVPQTQQVQPAAIQVPQIQVPRQVATVEVNATEAQGTAGAAETPAAEAPLQMTSFPKLLAAATSPDGELRQMALTALRGLGREAISPLTASLRDQDANRRHAAALVLGKLEVGEPAVVSALTECLRDRDERVRAAAAFALGQFGAAARSAIRDLARLVVDSEPAVRRQAVSALGGIGADAAVALPDLVRVATDSDAGVRRAVISVLAMLAPTTAEATFRQALSDSDGSVRRCAQMALSLLSNSGGTAIAAVESDTSRPVTAPAANLKIFHPDGESEVKQTQSETRPDAVAASATETVAKSAGPSVAELITQLDDAHSDVRWNATQALGQLGSEVVPSIVANLDHPNPETRRLLIMALGRIGAGARDAMPSLLHATSESNPVVRCAAIECLGRLGVVNRPMLQTLTKRLSDPDSEVRRYAATTLGRFGQYAREACVDLKVAAMSDGETKVRTAAQAALQRIVESLAEAA